MASKMKRREKHKNQWKEIERPTRQTIEVSFHFTGQGPGGHEKFSQHVFWGYAVHASGAGGTGREAVAFCKVH